MLRAITLGTKTEGDTMIHNGKVIWIAENIQWNTPEGVCLPTTMAIGVTLDEAKDCEGLTEEYYLVVSKLAAETGYEPESFETLQLSPCEWQLQQLRNRKATA